MDILKIGELQKWPTVKLGSLIIINNNNNKILGLTVFHGKNYVLLLQSSDPKIGTSPNSGPFIFEPNINETIFVLENCILVPDLKISSINNYSFLTQVPAGAIVLHGKDEYAIIGYSGKTKFSFNLSTGKFIEGIDVTNSQVFDSWKVVSTNNLYKENPPTLISFPDCLNEKIFPVPIEEIVED